MARQRVEAATIRGLIEGKILGPSEAMRGPMDS